MNWKEDEYDERKSRVENYQCFVALTKLKGINLKMVDKNKNSAIMACVARDKIECIKHLQKMTLDNGNINIGKESSKFYENALMSAATNSSIKTMKYLIESLGLYDEKEKSKALNIVCDTMRRYKKHSPRSGSNFECFRYLLNSPGIDVNIVDVNDNSYSPLMNCILRDKYEFLKYLERKCISRGLKLKPITEQFTVDGRNVLSIAARGGSYKIMEHLLSLNVYNYNNKKSVNNSLMEMIVAANKDKEWNGNIPDKYVSTLKLLLKNKHSNVNFIGSDGHSILSKCIMNSMEKFCMYIVDHYHYFISSGLTDANRIANTKKNKNKILDTSFKDNNGNDYLMIAAKYSNLKVLKKIIDLKLFENVNNVNKDGNSALLLAAQSDEKFWVRNQKKCINYLCFEELLGVEDVDKSIKNNSQQTVYSLCKEKQKTQFLSLLADVIE